MPRKKKDEALAVQEPPKKRPIEFQWVPIDKIIPNTWNINTEDDITFNLLQDEISSVGLIDPLEVVPTEDGLFVILSGEHRWRAAQNLGHEDVPCILLTDEKWKDADLQKFVSVRLNVIHGKTDPDKFVVFYNEMAHKYGAESMQRLMGYADSLQFQKMVGLVKKGLAKSLPKEMAKELEDKTKDVKTVQDLERIIQELFAKYGDTVNQSFMIFTYGKQQHIYVAMDAKMRRAMDKAMECCRLTGADMNDFMRPVVEDFVRKASVEIEKKRGASEEKVDF
jgi:acyl carrier protein